MVMLTALKLLHALCWVYWLGADIGTFYAARFVADRALTPAQRATAAKIMLGIDLAPRICMPLTLASGLNLAALSAGWHLPAAALALVWLACALWLATVLWLHHAPRGPQHARVTLLDFGWRVLLLAVLSATAAAGFVGAWPLVAPWLALKLLCFAASVACGLAIRVHLRPFATAFGALMQHGATPAGDAQIALAISRCVPYVVTIWVLLVVAAGSGLHWWP